jgi:hypothetical protein
MTNLHKRAYKLFFCGLFLIFLTSTAFGQNMFRKTMDFDGDGKADFAVTRDIGGSKYWYIWQSRDGFRVSQFGLATDQNIAGDYDGDGKYEPAIFRKTLTSPNSNFASFWVQGSQDGVFALSLIAPTIPSNSYALSQDYNGDGKMDFAMIVSSTGNLMDIIFTSGGNPDRQINPGGTLGKIGDMTGDGKADLFAYNQNTNIATIQTYIRGSLDGAKRTVQFGIAGDQFVAADFDGDGIGELAVFRPSDGTWWWIRSSDGVVNVAQFGQAGDVPVPADYDGDGKTDIAIWRSGAQSYFWVYGSQVGVFALPWGIADDTVVTY